MYTLARRGGLPASVLLMVLWAVAAMAQQTRTILQIPVNFRNDTSQPRTLAQLKADGDAGPAKWLFDNSSGAVTATSTVWDYVTLDMDKGCVLDRGILPVMNMTEFWTKLDAGLAARGRSRTRSGFNHVYIVIPVTFGKCSHDDAYGFAPHSAISGGDHAFLFFQRFGLPMALNWACRAALGSSVWVTMSPWCGPSSSTASGRDMTSIPGQGAGSLSAADRNRLTWLPAAQQATATDAGGQWTLARLENPNPSVGVRRLLIPAMGIELEYHAPMSSRDWDNRGVTGHVLGSSKRIDFTPDNFNRSGSTALEPGAAWIYNGLRLSVLKADLDVAVVDIRNASDPAPAPLVAPRCATTSPDPSINVTVLTDATCGVWKIDTLRRVFRGGFFAGYSDTLSFCNGLVYVPNGALWTRYASGASGAVMVTMNTPALPACMVGDPHPPPPPAEICDGIDNNGDGVIDDTRRLPARCALPAVGTVPRRDFP